MTIPFKHCEYCGREVPRSAGWGVYCSRACGMKDITDQQPNGNQMPIIARDEGGTFVPAPEGAFAAIAVDVIDLGMIDSTFDGQIKRQHKIRIAFQISESDADTGKPFLVSQQFTLSLNEKATLRKFLESWRGRAFTEQEVRGGFVVERLVGLSAFLQLIHVTRADKTYANINSIMKLPAGVPAIVARDYVRVKDRETTPATNGNGGARQAPAQSMQQRPQQGSSNYGVAPAVASTTMAPGRVADALTAKDPWISRDVPPLTDSDIPF